MVINIISEEIFRNDKECLKFANIFFYFPQKIHDNYYQQQENI